MKFNSFLILLSCCLYLANGAGQGESKKASNRLMKELQDVYKSKSYKNNDYSLELVGGSMYNWNVVVRAIDPSTPLYNDLQQLKAREGKDGILINIQFGPNYPFRHPFIRIVYPVLQGEHIYEGGALCMELLSTTGWSPAYTAEMAITQLSNFLSIYGRINFGARDQGASIAQSKYQWLDDWWRKQ